MKRNRIFAGMLAGLLTCTSMTAGVYASTDSTETLEGTMRSYLTGETVSEEDGLKRPVAFVIDNVNAASPQSGISSAEIVYESEVEADYSRLLAVFGDGTYQSLAKIGPLRSCRDYFISLSAGLDRIFTHYGQAAYALPYLESDEVDNLSGLMSYSYDAFFRDGPHEAPHNAYTSGENIDTLIETLGYRTTYEDGYVPEFTFAEEGTTYVPEDGADAAYVALGYPSNAPSFTLNEEDGLYYRTQFGKAHMDQDSGEQIAVRNIILEYQCGTTYQDSAYKHYETTGSGLGKLITGGKAIDITWERDDFYSPVVYKTMDGEPITLNTGKTWIAVIRKNQLRNCLIGSSSEETVCVADDATVEAEEADQTAWEADYKEGELEYLTKMAQLRTDLIAEHGGTKVEIGLP